MIPPYRPPVCECERLCDQCGKPAGDHPTIVDGEMACVFDTGRLPATYYHETHQQTLDSPAEGIEVCEQCGRERT